jgi:hypothetical protein
MQVLAVVGIFAAFALACAAIYVAGRALQRRGRDLSVAIPPQQRWAFERLLRQLPVDGFGAQLGEQLVGATERT